MWWFVILMLDSASEREKHVVVFALRSVLSAVMSEAMLDKD